MAKKVTLNSSLEGVDTAMKNLRAAMRGIPIRYAGFRGSHTAATRAVSNLTVTMTSARPLLGVRVVRRSTGR